MSGTEATADQGSSRPLPVLLVGCDEVVSSTWIRAAERIQLNCFRFNSVSDCRQHVSVYGGGIVIASTWPMLEASVLDASDISFKRTAVILISKNRQEVERWRLQAWDSYSDGVDIENAASALQAALGEARRKRDDWDLVEEFHTREATLTEDESLVMVAVCRGLLNKQVASSLSVSVRTVEQRRRHVFEKMGVDSVAPLATMVAKVYEIERRGQRRNSPTRSSRFWRNWESPHTFQFKPHKPDDYKKNTRIGDQDADSSFA